MLPANRYVLISDLTYHIFYVFGQVDSLQRELLQLYQARLASDARQRLPQVELLPLTCEDRLEQFKSKFADVSRSTDLRLSFVVKIGKFLIRNSGRSPQNKS